MSGGKSTQWRPVERAQMKAVHKAYRDGVMRNEEALQLPRMPGQTSNNAADPSDMVVLSSGSTGFTPPQLDALDQTLQRIEGRIQASYSQHQQQQEVQLRAAEGGIEGSPGGGASGNDGTNGSFSGGNPGGGSGRAGGDNTGSDTETGGQAGGDREWYMPRNSCLRSVGGEMLRAQNPPFRDHAAFVRSMDFEEWKVYFRDTTGDRYLVETAESLCSHACIAQARRELRVRNGSRPLGRVLHSKREHITPLALVMHELKLWATHTLRVASIYDQETYVEITRRIHYIVGLQKKEVWGRTKVAPHSGMRALAHDKLFRVLLSAKEDLTRARDYAYRGYCRRSSREKLAKTNNLLKNVMMHAMKIVSCLMSVHENLDKPTSRRLQPTDLLNSVHNQSFVDFRNVANVLLRGLVEVPLFRMTLLSDFPQGLYLPELEDWRAKNLFCRPSDHGNGKNELLVLINEAELESTGLSMPAVLAATSQRLRVELKTTDKHGQLPMEQPKFNKLLKKSFGSEKQINVIMTRMSMALAVIQDLVPICFACHALWEIAGDGGNFTVFDSLRAQVIQVMSNAMERVYIVQAALKALFDEIGTLVSAHKTKMEHKRLRTRKPEYEPAWVANHQVASVEMFPLAKRAFDATYKQLMEVMHDAWEYNLTEEQLTEKVEACKRTAAGLVNGDSSRMVDLSSRQDGGAFSVNMFVDPTKGDWLGLVNPAIHVASSSTTGTEWMQSSTSNSHANPWENDVEVMSDDDTKSQSGWSLVTSGIGSVARAVKSTTRSKHRHGSPRDSTNKGRKLKGGRRVSESSGQSISVEGVTDDRMELVGAAPAVAFQSEQEDDVGRAGRAHSMSL